MDPPLDSGGKAHRDRSGRKPSELPAHPAIAESATQEQKDQDNDDQGRR
jgi:hypothetical protein